MASDGTNVRSIAESLEVREAPSWSADGKWIAVCAVEEKANPLFKVPVDGGAPVRLVDGVEAVISNPVWSPDGRVILYSENRGGASTACEASHPTSIPLRCPSCRSGSWVTGIDSCRMARPWSCFRARSRDGTSGRSISTQVIFDSSRI